MELLGSQSPIIHQPDLKPASAGSAINLKVIDFDHLSRLKSKLPCSSSHPCPAAQTRPSWAQRAGKSIGLPVVAALYDPRAGRIVLDGVPTNDESA
jgi:hypothetical protein